MTQETTSEKAEKIVIKENEIEKQESLDSVKISIHFPDGKTQKIQVLKSTLLQNIRQHIYDTQSEHFITCFYLSDSPSGKALNEISQVGELTEIFVVNGIYNHHEIKVHINRLREIINYFRIAPSFSNGISQGSTFASQIGEQSLLADVKGTVATKEDTEKIVQALNNLDETDPFDFLSGYPSLLDNNSNGSKNTKCIESISMSRWNPVPLHRKMAGDIMYLSVQTLEGRQIEITCSVMGFHVNSSTSTHFAPEKTKKTNLSHTLVVLLESISPQFKEKFSEIQSQLRATHPFEYLPSTDLSIPWFVKSETIAPDLGRTMDTLFASVDSNEHNRDWNEDLQAAVELPRDSALDRMQRDQAIVRAYNDFVDAAIKSAMCVVDKSLVPINATDDEASQMFIHNNIFLSEGYDNKETFDHYGGAEASHVAISKDINGILAVQQLDLPKIHHLGTVLIDYKGQRILAQTIVPGILRKTDNVEEAPIQYGSVDGGKEILSNEIFAESAKKIAKLLHLSEHSVQDASGKSHNLATSVETKWVKGTDSRQYLLDLYRTCPVDACFLEKIEKEQETNPYPHKMVLLRHELLELYYEHTLRIAIKTYQEKIAAQNAELEANGKPPMTVEEINAGFQFSLHLNPDVFTHVLADVTGDEIEADKEAVRDASGFISVCISKLVMDYVKSSNGIPVDSEGLVRDFHRRGINMRYLGQVAELFDKMTEYPIESFKSLLREEVVSRVAKRLLRDYLKSLEVFQAGKCISHFFNCLFADNTPALSKNAPEGSFEGLSSSLLHARIVQEVKSRFRYDGLKDQFWKTRQATLLRSICIKVGIQILCKKYDFTSSSARPIFVASDILNIYPIVKKALPKASFAAEAMEHGRMSVSSGQKETGLELMREAISMTEQIYGPIHSETGQVYASFAIFLFNLDEIVQAVLFQRRAVIVSERCNGIDSAQTLQQYMNLAYYEYAAGNPTLGLKYMKYALNRWKFLNTDSHPDTPTLSANIGAMLQKLEEHDIAIKYFSSSLQLNQSLLGPDHENTASSYDLLTKAHFLKGDYRSSLAAQQQVYKFYKKVVGEEDERTKNSATLLKYLTGKAVEVAKAQKGLLKKTPNVENVIGSINPKLFAQALAK